MYNQASSGLFKGMNAMMTKVSILMVLVTVVMGSLYTEVSATGISTLRGFLNPFLEWYYVILVAFLLFFMIWLGTGRYKNVRLGGDSELPEFTFFSWVSMLFAAGTGVGILFWSVAQPIMQFQDNPFVMPGTTDADAAVIAMRLSFFHWGINGWAIFSFVALTMAYFAFRHDLPLTVRSALYPILGEKVRGPLGDIIDLLAVFGTVFGIATTLGLGVQQMNAGLSQVFGLASSTQLQLTVIAVIMVIATASVVSGVSKGVRLLSEMNFWLSIAAVSFMLLLGPTQYLIGVTIEATGDYIQSLLRMTFHTNVTHGDSWQADWTVFFWGWWLAWSPFVGMFIARISRGRTFREFVMGVLLVPTGITIIWIGLFGGTALYQELFGPGGVVEAVDRDVSTALFVTVEGMGVGQLTPVFSTLLIVLIGTYLITSANAGTLVINTILSGGDADPPSAHRVLWGVFLALLTGVLLVAGGLETLQSAVITAAMPFSVIVVGMIFGLLRALAGERFAAREGERKTAPAEPWAVTDCDPEEAEEEEATETGPLNKLGS
ncbi:choline/glycine/proline betaine transport protein [Marinospirillum celere]|uniref:Choline/glycine/proline betaine transport protein n=1 Tax=Marinospirillum celere TaxID=1122252 RepID=A0A1I1J9M3_9GAMM|nr:BCCT family transporter [Marinospirillum celere]SFC45254.1 choline/glycine/proline betaine transport protein [Marinospirillum celere]